LQASVLPNRLGLCEAMMKKKVYIPCFSDNCLYDTIGMKSPQTRNFEAGILTDDPTLVEQAMNQFDSVWAGIQCKNCGRKKFCSDPIAKWRKEDTEN